MLSEKHCRSIMITLEIAPGEKFLAKFSSQSLKTSDFKWNWPVARAIMLKLNHTF